MNAKVKCTCGHSWNKSDSSKKDMNVCHVCGKDNTMKNGGWLDNYGKVDNANESDVSLPEGFVGLAYDTSGRKNSPAWGGQFQTGGKIQQAQDGILEKLKTNLNPYNWGVEDYTDKYPDKNKAFAAARKAGEKEYLYKGVRYPTTLKSLPGERIKERDDFKGGLFSYSASGGNRADSYGDNAIGDAYRYYGGLPLKSNELGISKYKPTSSTNPDARYVSIHNEQFLKDIETYSSIAFDDNKRKEFNDKRFAKMKKSRPDLSEADYEKIVPFKYVYDKQGKIIPNTYTFPTGSGTTGDKNSSRGLGNMFISKGKDDEGDYISYYDVFNKNTGKVTKETGEGWATKPYEIYDRIYFKDYGDGKQKRMYYSDKELSELDVNKKNFDTLALQRELSNRGYELTKSKKSDGNFDGVLGEETKKALEDLQNKKKSFATGGSIPGTPGFTYARTAGSAPSEGKYAKKTMPSAQNGQEMKFYQEGLDWKPKSMQEGGEIESSEDLKNAREKAFKTIQPSSYDDLKNMARWVTNTERKVYDDPRSEEFWRYYLKQPGDLQYLRPSKYSPTITKSQNNNTKYLSVDDELEQAIFNAFNDKLQLNEVKQVNEDNIAGKYEQDGLQNFLTTNPGLGDRNPSGNIARALGNFTVSKGSDDKGEYLSYYDTYDFPNWIQNRVKGDPYEIYGRVYYPKKKREGGVIKDNRGQWDYPGEITEINSNYITMGPDPETGEPIRNKVLGVSNEGDTKIMLPGENYKFKGEKVTEYPLMQKGGRVGINDLDAQPNKKLNQLLNFTNNPDKNWLNKYQ
jgi:hypothetical protein